MWLRVPISVLLNDYQKWTGLSVPLQWPITFSYWIYVFIRPANNSNLVFSFFDWTKKIHISLVKTFRVQKKEQEDDNTRWKTYGLPGRSSSPVKAGTNAPLNHPILHEKLTGPCEEVLNAMFRGFYIL